MSQGPIEYDDLTYSLAGVKRQNPYDQRRKYAYSQLQAGSDTSPIQSPWQGASRLAQALVGGWSAGQADRDEQASVEKQQTALATAMAEPDPQKRIALLGASNPELGARLSGQLAVEQAKLKQQGEQLQAGAGTFGGSYGAGPQQARSGTGDAAAAISGIESGGRYDAVGPVADAKGSRAYGKFQVMDYNIGPWTQEVLGKAMTPQEFLATPQAQDAVFQTKFGQMAQRHGSQEAASREWFGGPGGMNNPNATDVNGMTVQRYGQKFAQSYGPGAGPQIAQGNNPQVAPGMPPQPSAQGVQGPAISAPPVPQVPFPQPTPQMLQQYQQRIASGEFGTTPQQAIPAARAAMQAELKQQWEYDRHLAEKGADREYDAYKDQRKREGDQPQQNVKVEHDIRQQFEKNQAVIDFRKVQTVFKSAVNAHKVDTPAADLNMVYAFATLMDPGSVVRDQEGNMVLNTQTASEKVKGLFATVTGGSRLSPEARNNLLHEMAGRYEAYKGNHDALAEGYKGIATRSGVNPENVFVGLPEVKYELPKVQQMSDRKGGGGTTGGPTEYEYRGGKLVPRK